MNRRERMLAIFQGRLPDRPAVKLWNATPSGKLLHPDYAPIRDLALELTDLFVPASSPFNVMIGNLAHDAGVMRTHTAPTADPQWVDEVLTIRTRRGELRAIFKRSTAGHPGYREEHLCKEPDDLRALLELPYEPMPFDVTRYADTDASVGERGVAAYWLDHAMYGVQRAIGSENLAMWSLECPELLLEAMHEFARRIRIEADRVFDAGLTPIFAWVGPELCIPPLMSPADFDRYVGALDKPLIDHIHNRGGHVWVHCHGKMSPVLERFAAMGVDVLNPVEPPPMGDVTLTQAFEMVGNRMALEGNIQTHELMTADGERIRDLVEQSLDAGSGKRFILCPTSGYMEDPQPPKRLLDNLRIYIEHAAAHLHRCTANKLPAGNRPNVEASGKPETARMLRSHGRCR